MRLRPLGQPLLVALTCLAAGASAALIWLGLWTPVVGVAFEHEFVLGPEGAPRDFSTTGGYVAWALVAGVVAGLVAGLVTDRAELLTLAMLLAGAVAGAVLMAQLGHRLGPADPRAAARTLEDFSTLDADLRVQGVAPYLALPAGAMWGLMVEYLGEATIRRVRRPASGPTATLAA